MGWPGGSLARILNLTDGSENSASEWNTLEIECIGGVVQLHVNGDLVNHGFNCTLTEGQIAIQAEGTEVEFHNLELTWLA